MQVNIVVDNVYRSLLKHFGCSTINEMDWYEVENSKVTICGQEFEIRGNVEEEHFYKIKRFRTDKKPFIRLEKYSFPPEFWQTQNG